MCKHKNSTILVCMILNGDGYLISCGLHGDILTGQSNIANCFVGICIIVGRWRTTLILRVL